MIHLLDVCALIALGYPSHVHNQRVERWAADTRRNANEPVAFATCAITEPGFVRIGSADSERRFGHDVGATLATVDGGIPGALLIPFLPDTEWRVEEPAAHYGTAA